MLIVQISAGILLFSLLIWSVFFINNYCNEKYQYKPFGVGIWILIAVPAVLVAFASVILYEVHTLPVGHEPPNPKFIENAYGALAVSGLILLGVFARVWSKTSFLIAVFSLLIQILLSAFSVLLAFIMLVRLRSD